ncbi:tetratricopeptide repeat protein [Candidatus Avelusimicrobium alvi]|uniref:tetratricopeptide repeat protein n=1 Tax=Candidatus Avelusimicrobium alvi TaxID=3416221 RepID=UPI003D09EA48
MKKHFTLALVLALAAASAQAATFRKEVPVRQHGKEEGMLLDLSKISMGTLNDVEEKKQYLSTVQLEKQRIQNYTLRMVYENAYLLYKRGDYQRAQEMAQTILSIDPNFKQAQTLAKQASHMGTYGTTSEAEVIEAKFQETIRLYDSGRLVEANDKLNEILTIQPGNSKAQAWKRKIDYDIAKEYTRRGDEAYAQNDYQKALDAWYNALLMRKDDPKLVAKIADTENKLRKQQVADSMKQALDFYNKGQFVESYAVFERITKIQPGDPRVQKYMSQLKNEIAGGYYNAGSKSYNSNRFDQAIAYWTNAKKWGADSTTMDGLIKRARNAKENHLRVKQQQAIQAEQAAQRAEEAAQKAEEQANQQAEQLDEEPIETVTVDGNVPGLPGGTLIPGSTGTPGTSGGIGSSVGGVGANETLPTIGGTVNRVSAEASAASRAKYIEGLDAFNQDDYERARQAWIVAKQLDPGNSDADLGLRKVEELMR